MIELKYLKMRSADMSHRKEKQIYFFLLISLAAISLPAPNQQVVIHTEAADSDTPAWSYGDVWAYRNNGKNIPGEVPVRLEVRVISEAEDIHPLGHDGLNTTYRALCVEKRYFFQNGSTINDTCYYNATDLRLCCLSIYGLWEGPPGGINYSRSRNISFTPPAVLPGFPEVAGRRWKENGSALITTTDSATGETRKEYLNYTAEGNLSEDTVEFKTNAGSFQCFLVSMSIKCYAPGGEEHPNYTFTTDGRWSSQVGNFVSVVENGWKFITGPEFVLESYNYRHNSILPWCNFTAYLCVFLVILPLGAIFFIAGYLQRRRQSAY